MKRIEKIKYLKEELSEKERIIKHLKRNLRENKKRKIIGFIKIKMLARVLNRLLCEEVAEFGTFYTNKITDICSNNEKKLVYTAEQLRELEEKQKKLWLSFDFYYKNDNDFRAKSDKIFNILFVESRRRIA